MSLAICGAVVVLIIIIVLLFAPIYVTIYGIPVLFIGWIVAETWWEEMTKDGIRRVEREQKLNQRKEYILKREVELKGQRLSLSRQERLQKLLPLYRKLPDGLKFKLEEHIVLFQEIVEFKKWKIEEMEN